MDHISPEVEFFFKDINYFNHSSSPMRGRRIFVHQEMRVLQDETFQRNSMEILSSDTLLHHRNVKAKVILPLSHRFKLNTFIFNPIELKDINDGFIFSEIFVVEKGCKMDTHYIIILTSYERIESTLNGFTSGTLIAV